MTSGPGRRNHPEVSADAIRARLLGRDADGAADGSPSHVALSGARITGLLDLRNLQRPDGTALPSLELTDCAFERMPLLTHASLRRLSLAGSRLPGLDAREARIDGSVDLSGIRPLEPDGACRVDLHGARIGGDLKASRATLRSPVRLLSERDVNVGDARPALDLRLSKIDGEVVLQPGFRAFGGVHLRDASVAGTLWLAGAHLELGESYALNCQGLRVGSGMYLGVGTDASDVPEPFTAIGHLHLLGVSIGGNLWMAGARLMPPGPAGDGSPDERDPDLEWSGLLLENGTVGGTVTLSVAVEAGPDGPVEFPVQIDGNVWMDSVTIAGNLDLAGAEISETITAARSRIGGDFDLRGHGDHAASCGQVLLGDAEIRGSVALLCASDTVDVSRAGIGGHFRVSGPARIVSGVDARIGGDVFLALQPVADEEGTLGVVNLLDADVAGMVTLDGAMGGAQLGRARIGKQLSVQGRTEALALDEVRVGMSLLVSGRTGDVFLKDAAIGGDLWFKSGSVVGHAVPGDPAPHVQLHDAQVDGSLALMGVVGVPGDGRRALFGFGVRVGNRVEINGATLHGDVVLPDMEVGQGFQLLQSGVHGSLELPRIRVGGDLELLTSRIENRVALRQAQVGGHLKTADLDVAWTGDFRSPAVIDLDDARIASEITVSRTPAAESTGGAASPGHDPGTVLAVRSTALPFLSRWRLVEAVVDRARVQELGGAEARSLDRPGVAGFLWRRSWPGQRAEILPLPGSNQVMFDFVARGDAGFELANAAQAVEYLLFFSHYGWGDAGAFRIVHPDDPRLDAVRATEPDASVPVEVQPPRVIETIDEPGRRAFVVRAWMLYGRVLFRSEILVRTDGSLELRSEEQVGELTGPLRDRWISPFRFAAELDADASPQAEFPPTFRPRSGWRAERGRRGARLRREVAGTLRRPLTEVWLEDARAERLDDLDGRGWGSDVRLRLDGFTYDRAHSRRDRDIDPLGASGARTVLRRLRHEAGLYDCTGLRRRPLACVPGAWLVELSGVFRVDGDATSYRRGVASFAWEPALTSGAVPLGAGGADAAALRRWRGLRAGDRELETPAAVVDYLRLALHEREAARIDAVRSAAGTQDGWEVVARIVSRAGIRDGRYTVARDGTIEFGGADEVAPAEAAGPDRHVGPFRLVESGVGPGADDDADVSPWGDDGWETLLPAEDGAAALAATILRDCAPTLRARLDDELRLPAGDRPADPTAPATGAGSRPARPLAAPWRRLRRALGDTDGRAANRLRWLRLQYPDGEPTLESHHSHPYEVLAAALRNEGEDRAARRVLSEKLRTETRIETWRRKPGRKLFNRFFGTFFDYGLSSGRALFSTGALLALGWAGVAWLNTSGLLVVDFTPSATVVVDSPGGADGRAPSREMALAVAEPGRAEPRVPCGDNISNLVFAADHMVPILEFGQRHRCQVAGTRPPGAAGWWTSPGLWQVALTLYSVAGAIVVSIALLTISGVLRRHAEA